MDKKITLTAKRYDENGCTEFEVTYHFDAFRETGGAFIWCEYEGEDFLRLTQNNGELPNPAWTYMIFHHSMYWLVTPLLYTGIIKMNPSTSFHPNKQYHLNQILVEVSKEYLVNKK